MNVIAENKASQGVDGARKKKLFEIRCSRKALQSRGLETIWGKIILGGKESQCSVTEVGQSWAYSQKSDEDPVAGTDGTEGSDG